jgi:hypothetical protein
MITVVGASLTYSFSHQNKLKSGASFSYPLSSLHNGQCGRNIVLGKLVVSTTDDGSLGFAVLHDQRGRVCAAVRHDSAVTSWWLMGYR